MKETPPLNVAAWLERSVVNGPGARFVLWVQSCPLACPGCFSPETHPFEPQQMVEIEEIAEKILAAPGIAGVTYSGGEPTLQAQGLVLPFQN